MLLLLLYYIHTGAPTIKEYVYLKPVNVFLTILIFNAERRPRPRRREKQVNAFNMETTFFYFLIVPSSLIIQNVFVMHI